MRKTLRNLLAGIGLFSMIGLSGCPAPASDNHRDNASIVFSVERITGTTADNITYGSIEHQGGDWINDSNYFSFGPAALPWTSGAYSYETGHWIRLYASSPGKQIKLIIKDDGKVAASKDATTVGKLEYFIPETK